MMLDERALSKSEDFAKDHNRDDYYFPDEGSATG